MVHMLTTSLPTYDSRGEPQKLYEFIQKHDDFLDVAELTPSLVLVLALAKLNGPAYLWWHDHISKYLNSDEGCMRRWDDLKRGLVAAFIPPESVIVLLMQLKTLRQNSMTVTDFNAKFNKLTMQVNLRPIFFLTKSCLNLFKTHSEFTLNIGCPCGLDPHSHDLPQGNT